MRALQEDAEKSFPANEGFWAYWIEIMRLRAERVGQTCQGTERALSAWPSVFRTKSVNPGPKDWPWGRARDPSHPQCDTTEPCPSHKEDKNANSFARRACVNGFRLCPVRRQAETGP